MPFFCSRAGRHVSRRLRRGTDGIKCWGQGYPDPHLGAASGEAAAGDGAALGVTATAATAGAM